MSHKTTIIRGPPTQTPFPDNTPFIYILRTELCLQIHPLRFKSLFPPARPTDHPSIKPGLNIPRSEGPTSPGASTSDR